MQQPISESTVAGASPGKKPKSDIKQLNQWVADAKYAHQNWRDESWRAEEFFDGKQWSAEDLESAKTMGITPLTINRIFPVVNLAKGVFALNPLDMQAKARTQDDSEKAMVMSEAIKFVMDQNFGKYLVGEAFHGALVPGIGFLEVTINPDPRYERIRVVKRDWKTVWWDPFASPWMDSSRCRFCFYQPWMDLDDLCAIFPEKEKELREKYLELTSGSTRSGAMSGAHQDLYDTNDHASIIEYEKRNYIGTDYMDRGRRRVRPVEMWHPVFRDTWFAVFRDGSVFELHDSIPAQQQFQMIQQSSEVVSARVRKMVKTTFLGDLILEDGWSPWHHDEFPQVAFVGYLDRWAFPYGIPHQIKDQNMEVNKRRSMALALLGAKRVIADSSVAKDQDQLNGIYAEAQKPNGFVIVDAAMDGRGVNQRIIIDDQSALAAPQVQLMQLSENEIQQISGANDEQLGYKSNAESGRAINARQQQGATIMAPVFDNLRRSLNLLGTRIVSGVQQHWNGEKVLRVTDRLSGADKFVELNKRAVAPDGRIMIINNVTQGRYDLIVSETPASDTIREKNLELVIEWVKRSPPEVAPILLSIAFELSDLPNKELILTKIKPMLGLNPADADKTEEQIKQEAVAALEAQRKEVQQVKQMEFEQWRVQMERQALENEKLRLDMQKVLEEIRRSQIDARNETLETKAQVAKTEAEITQTGFEMGHEMVKTAIDASRPAPQAQGPR